MIPAPVNPVVVSVTVKVIVIVLTIPTAGTIKIPFAPGKTAVPPEVVVVAVGAVNVSDGLLEAKEDEMSIVCPAKSLVNGSLTVTKVTVAGRLNANVLPVAAVVVNAKVGGAVTVSDLPVMLIVAKLVRLSELAITVIVCEPLKAGGLNATPIDPELLVLLVPKEMFWLPIWTLNVMGTPVKSVFVGLVYVAVALTTDPVAVAVTVIPPFNPEAPLPLPQPNTANESRITAKCLKYISPPYLWNV